MRSPKSLSDPSSDSLEASPSLPRIDEARKVLEEALARYRNEANKFVAEWCEANSDIVHRAWVIPEDFNRERFELKVIIMHPQGLKSYDQSDRVVGLDIEIANRLPECVWCDASGVDYCSDAELVDCFDPVPEHEVKFNRPSPS